ncbi:FkbM family methyltransferase [Candidatus Kaiserbacteria bacterium]|nr:FkbM family methyltransferase [Candidatus Kaiserbacteria bacterium]
MRRLLKNTLTALVDTYARWQRFSFPEKYSWRWKLDMLIHRYEPETTRLFKQIVREGGVVIDVGAHIGYFTRLAAGRVGRSGRVYAFEPESENRTLLIENTKWFDNVITLGEAITDRSGTVAFYRIRGSTGCHSTIAQENAERSLVPATTLDVFMRENSIEHADVIKIDIEGGEAKALQGMEQTLRGIRHLIIEYNPAALSRAGADPRELLSTLQEKGFTISVLSRGKEIPLSDIHDVSAYLTSGSVNLHCKKS